VNPNVKKWPVTVLTINRRSRHRDKPAHMEFWNKLDKFIATRKRVAAGGF